MRARLSPLLAAALLAAPLTAHAAPPDEATKAAARKIAEEGLALYDGGKYAEALDRFVRVDALVHAPTMLLMAARSLDKLGRLVEASEKYAAASQVLLAADASDAFRDAVKDAERERAALLSRIPSIIMIVDAPPGAELKVELDGASISAESLGQKKLIDPGAHTLTASSADAKTSSSIVIKEGESRTVHLDLQTGGSPPPLRIVGWSALGAGAAGLVIGAVTGGLALARKGELDKNGGCDQDGFCSKASAADLDSYNLMRTVSGAGFTAGAILAAGGAALLIFGPKPAPAETGARVRWSPWIGAGSLGVRGVF